MTKGYVCAECGSQVVGHSQTECDAQHLELCAQHIERLEAELDAEKLRVEMLSAGWKETTRQLEEVKQLLADCRALRSSEHRLAGHDKNDEEPLS